MSKRRRRVLSQRLPCQCSRYTFLELIKDFLTSPAVVKLLPIERPLNVVSVKDMMYDWISRWRLAVTSQYLRALHEISCQLQPQKQVWSVFLTPLEISVIIGEALRSQSQRWFRRSCCSCVDHDLTCNSGFYHGNISHTKKRSDKWR